MNHIRPYRFFGLFDAPISERIAHVPIPNRRGSGGISLLEAFLLTAAVRIVDARRMFEFGTFLGSTTLILATNSPDDAVIFTLDLDDDSARGLNQDCYDEPLTGIHLAACLELDFAKSPARNKIRTLSGNSVTFDFSSWANSVDLVFVDGGHDVPTARADTKNALSIATRDKPSCILWHDYRNPEYPDLTVYLDELSREFDMFHIEDTKLCVAFSGPCEHLTNRLLVRE
jgi:hypothetical protein